MAGADPSPRCAPRRRAPRPTTCPGQSISPSNAGQSALGSACCPRFRRFSSRRIAPLLKASSPFPCNPCPQIGGKPWERVLLVPRHGLHIPPQGRLHLSEVRKGQGLVDVPHL